MVTNRQKHAALELGIAGEDAAVEWYRRHGYEVVERNWSCFEGEIDVIACRGVTIAICEVKARASSRFVDPALAVGPKKRDRVRTAAFRWLAATSRQGQLRFDVALVVNGRLQMMQGAF